MYLFTQASASGIRFKYEICLVVMSRPSAGYFNVQFYTKMCSSKKYVCSSRERSAQVTSIKTDSS